MAAEKVSNQKRNKRNKVLDQVTLRDRYLYIGSECTKLTLIRVELLAVFSKNRRMSGHELAEVLSLGYSPEALRIAGSRVKGLNTQTQKKFGVTLIEAEESNRAGDRSHVYELVPYIYVVSPSSPAKEKFASSTISVPDKLLRELTQDLAELEDPVQMFRSAASVLSAASGTEKSPIIAATIKIQRATRFARFGLVDEAEVELSGCDAITSGIKLPDRTLRYQKKIVGAWILFYRRELTRAKLAVQRLMESPIGLSVRIKASAHLLICFLEEDIERNGKLKRDEYAVPYQLAIEHATSSLYLALLAGDPAQIFDAITGIILCRTRQVEYLESEGRELGISEIDNWFALYEYLSHGRPNVADVPKYWTVRSFFECHIRNNIKGATLCIQKAKKLCASYSGFRGQNSDVAIEAFRISCYEAALDRTLPSSLHASGTKSPVPLEYERAKAALLEDRNLPRKIALKSLREVFEDALRVQLSPPS